MAIRSSRFFANPVWNFWGVVIGVIGVIVGLLGVYAGFHQREAGLRLDIVGESDVLDIRQSLPDLQVMFQGEDIQRQDLNLRIITLRITNDGEVDIVQSLYDQFQPWGFELTSGRIIEMRSVVSPSEYLKSSVKPRLLNSNRLEFEKVILERGQSFAMEFVVLHPRNDAPDIRFVGKIAGIEQVVPTRMPVAQTQPGFIEQVFAGGLFINVVRGIIFFSGLFVLLAIVLPSLLRSRQ
jgi:hypothetical protein